MAVVAPASRCLPRELGRSLNVPVTRLDALHYDEQWDPLDHEVNRRRCPLVAFGGLPPRDSSMFAHHPPTSPSCGSGTPWPTTPATRTWRRSTRVRSDVQPFVHGCEHLVARHAASST